MEREMAMNQYGGTARRHWQTWLPDAYAGIPDPETFFATLGEEVAQEIQERSRSLAGDDPPDEGYTTKLARLNAARLEAEGDVLRERVLLPPEDEKEEDPATLPEEEWLPVVEDQTHPFWRQLRQETETEADHEPASARGAKTTWRRPGR